MERRYAWNRIEDERETTRAPFRFDSRARPVCAKISTHLRSPITIYRVKITRITGGEKSNGRNEICICMEDYASPSPRHFLRVRLKIDKNCANVTSIEDINEFFNDSFCFSFFPEFMSRSTTRFFA